MPPEEAPLGDVSARAGKVRSHRFLAVNTALPHLRGDADTIGRIETFLKDAKLSVDLFAMKRTGSGETKSEETLWPLDHARPALRSGETVEIHAVVRNRGVGHTFPGGTNDSNEGWLEVTVADAAGTTLFHSGAIRPDGYLEPSAHRYHAIIVTDKGEAVHDRVPTVFRATVYARVIPPSSSDLARYRFRVPEALPAGPLRVEAHLRWRKFDQPYVDFVFAGKEKPTLPIIASAAVALEVGPGAAHPHQALPAAEWTRLNDYGIALFLQGDNQAAARAFEALKTIAPERADGARNLTRVALAEGDLVTAERELSDAEKVAPGDPQSAFFWADLLMRKGQYDLALKAYGRVLDYFPSDRQALFQSGRALYLKSEFAAAIKQFLEVLAIDPEHRESHYHRLLCYRALGETAAAAEAEKAYSKYQIDETAQEFTQPFRQKNPEANLEAQRIHVHE
ncbi:MAG: hypothetical protein FD180_5222 [Planctomycetota bacterium]|nr:MAG: hypothetical protein FD180_5222 [Planctomycetota bacterium]